MKSACTSIAVVSVLCCTTSSTAIAASGYTGIHPQMNKALNIMGGAFLNRSHVNYELDLRSRDGSEVDADDLGADENHFSPFVALRWRFTDRWRLEGTWFKNDNSVSDQISERILWGDLDFEVGANVKLKNETSILRGAVGYSFLKNDRAEMGAGIGVHFLDATTKLSGTATINGEPVIGASTKSQVDGWAPNVALFGGYAINEQWFLGARADWISADIGSLDGSLTRIAANVHYQPFKNVGFGAGYDWLKVDVNKKSGDGGKNRLDGGIHGPQVFVSVNFF